MRTSGLGRTAQMGVEGHRAAQAPAPRERGPATAGKLPGGFAWPCGSLASDFEEEGGTLVEGARRPPSSVRPQPQAASARTSVDGTPDRPSGAGRGKLGLKSQQGPHVLSGGAGCNTLQKGKGGSPSSASSQARGTRRPLPSTNARGTPDPPSSARVVSSTRSPSRTDTCAYTCQGLPGRNVGPARVFLITGFSCSSAGHGFCRPARVQF